MSKKVCPQCSCTDVSQDWYAHDQGVCFVCNTCGFVGDTEEFKEQTVFHSITQSPEALAETLVYQFIAYDRHGLFVSCWRSVLTGNIEYYKESEALTATLEKLKEVENV